MNPESTPTPDIRSVASVATLVGDVLVQLDRVALTYGSGATAVVAVHGASCQVMSGARMAVTGPSGSGKSSLLHLMAGLERPTSGQITWPGLGDPMGRPGLIGVIFQGPSLIPALDAVENVALPLILAGAPDREAREIAMDALRTLGVDELATKLPDELSGGQAQRIAIARTMAARPRLILADEPTGQLDHDTGAHVIDVLLEAADHLDAAVVISTHDTLIAQRLDTRWRMRDGALLIFDQAVPTRQDATS